ncbi:hypothetical protein TNCV_4519671 [Trichonephila clavipes]|nr:hypothetical protein TNCV_4519671 [Trichonephila clavipes]
MSSSLVPLKTRREKAPMRVKYVETQTSSCCCGVEVREGVPVNNICVVIYHGSQLRSPSPKSPRAAELWDVNIRSFSKNLELSTITDNLFNFFEVCID